MQPVELTTIVGGRGAKCKRVRDGLERPTTSLTDAPSRGSWSGVGCPPSAPWFSHWSPCRTARWGFLSGWEEREINMEKWWRITLKCMSRSSHTIRLNVTCVTLCCQNTDAWAAVSQSITKLQTSDYICTHEWLRERACDGVYMWQVFMCNNILRHFYTSY